MAIYKRGRGFELGRTEKQIQEVARAGLEPGTAGLRVQHADHSATLPCIFQFGREISLHYRTRCKTRKGVMNAAKQLHLSDALKRSTRMKAKSYSIMIQRDMQRNYRSPHRLSRKTPRPSPRNRSFARGQCSSSPDFANQIIKDN